MSRVTEILLGNIDYEEIRSKRIDNYHVLCNELNDINEMQPDWNVVSPMIYPLLLENEGMRKYLIEHNNRRIDELVGVHAGKVLFDYVEGRINPIPQDDDKAVFGAKRNIEDCMIDFSMNNLMMRRFFAALTPNYPYPMLKIRGKKYEVMPKAEIVDKKHYGPIGRAVNINERGVWIKTKGGYLIVKKVREYGKEECELSQLVPIGYRFEK